MSNHAINAIIAVNPQQMQEAQATTIGWIDAKLLDAKRELATHQETFISLKQAGLRTLPMERLTAKTHKRIKFYTKVRAALDAGYYIIPPFDIQLFAVRTDRASPNETSTRSWANEQAGRSLPVGEGAYVNPVVGRHKIGTQKAKNHDGSMCAWIRYGGDGPEDPCECLCHGWPEDEDDYLG